MTTMSNLWIIMPVYNEEEAVGSVIEEWVNTLESLTVPYTFCILNDGSKDKTQEVLERYRNSNNRIKIIQKANTGHGQTCVTGYKIALENQADWIFQIDSDGQCDPKFFHLFLKDSQQYKAIFGYRKVREDGFSRFIISRFVSLFAFAATGVWMRDANVPYRLIDSSLIKNALPLIHEDFYLANIYLSILIKRQTNVRWVNIVFRERSGGTPSIKTYSIMKHGITLYRQLKATSNARI